MSNLVDLRGFRIKNRIKQAELAEFLGTSAAFISLIETGQNKLPEDKIRKILREGAMQKPWYVECLIPAYARIMHLHNYLKENFSLRYLPPKNSPLYLNEKIASSIMLGKIDISDDIATAIVDKLKPFVQINKQWLITGEGEMIIPSNDEISNTDLKKRIKILEQKYESLLSRIKRLESQLDVNKS